jgi:hypothetical protein
MTSDSTPGAPPGHDDDQPYLAWAGPVAWPARVDEFSDVRLCPACQSVLPSAVCSTCGLDLTSPRAAELLAASDAVIAAVRHRSSLIGRIRYESAQAAEIAARHVAERAAGQASEWGGATAQFQPAQFQSVQSQPAQFQPAQFQPREFPTGQAVPEQFHAGQFTPDQFAPGQFAAAPIPPQTFPQQPRQTGASRQPKRSSVQILLLIAGVSLVAIAAVFFLTVAWIFSGIAVRSIIVGCVTAATLVAAAVLHRRRLEATAEGIGALGSALVLLDVWALRATNTFSFDRFDALAYWGFALLICAALFFAWHVVSGLRVASLSASLVVAPGVAFLAAGLTGGLDPASRLFWAAIGAAIGTMIYRLTTADNRRLLPHGARTAEQIVLISIATCALALATVAAFFVAPLNDWAPLWSFGLLAVVAAAHVAVGLSFPRPAAVLAVFVAGAAMLAALALSLAAPLVAVRLGSAEFGVTAPLLVAATVALCGESALRRGLPPTLKRPMLYAAITASSIAILAAAGSLAAAILPTGRALVAIVGSRLASTNATETAAILALVGAGLIAAAVWAWSGVLRKRMILLAWLALMIVVLGVAFTTALWPMIGLYFVLGAAALMVALVLRGREFGRYRAILTTCLAVAGSLGYLISWTSSSTWWIGSTVVIAMLVLARYLLPRQQGNGRGALLSGALVAALIAAGAAPQMLRLGVGWDAVPASANVMAGMALACVVLQVLVAIVRRGVSVSELRWSFFTLLLPTVVTIAYPSEVFSRGWETAVLQPEPLGSIVRVSVLAAVPLLWLLARPRETVLRAERLVALALLAPAITLLQLVIFSAARLEDPQPLAAPIAAALCCALALAVRLGLVGRVRAADPWTRRALELGSAVILLPWLVVVAVQSRIDPSPLGWLAALIAGAATLCVAIAPDGLFSSRSPRRHFGWVALFLAVAGLWMGLDRAGASDVELYVLPVAGALIIIAELLRRFGPSRVLPTASPVAASLVLAGLLIAALPIAVAGSAGPLVRPLVLAIVCGALMIAAAWLRWTHRWWPYLAAIAIATTAGLAVVSGARAISAFAPPLVNGRLEAWLIPFAIALMAASVGLARQTHATTAASRRIAVIVAAGVGLAVALIPSALASGSEVPLRPILVLSIGAPLVLAAALVLLVRRDAVTNGRPVIPTIALIAVGAGSVAVVATVALRVVSLATDGPVSSWNGLSSSGALLEAWLLPASITVGVAGVVLEAGRRADSSASVASGSAGSTGIQTIAWLLSVGALVGITAVELFALSTNPIGEARAISLTWFLSAFHVAAFWFAGNSTRRLVRLLRALSWLAIALASVASITAIVVAAAHPVEIVTLPVAVALLATGWLQLQTNRAARSWPWLGPGVAILLGPSLILDVTQNPLWRVVALGVVAIVVLVVGVLRRLQAPFLLGCAAVLIHALAQLWPWITIAYSAVPWWLWLGVGGVLLIVLAARYEQRIKNFRSIALRIGSLR